VTLLNDWIPARFLFPAGSTSAAIRRLGSSERIKARLAEQGTA
jgi:hypothetical protein